MRPRLSQDDRFDLVWHARSQAKRSQPKGLVVAAGLVCLIAGVALITAYLEKSSAHGQLSADQRELREVEALVARVERAQAQSGGRDVVPGLPMPRLTTEIQKIAEETGLESLGTPNEPDPDSVGGGRVRRVRYTDIRHDTLGDVLAWVERATGDIDGLELVHLNITPNPDEGQWRVTVEFRRWEMAS